MPLVPYKNVIYQCFSWASSVHFAIFNCIVLILYLMFRICRYLVAGSVHWFCIFTIFTLARDVMQWHCVCILILGRMTPETLSRPGGAIFAPFLTHLTPSTSKWYIRSNHFEYSHQVICLNTTSSP